MDSSFFAGKKQEAKCSTKGGYPLAKGMRIMYNNKKRVL